MYVYIIYIYIYIHIHIYTHKTGLHWLRLRRGADAPIDRPAVRGL